MKICEKWRKHKNRFDSRARYQSRFEPMPGVNGVDAFFQKFPSFIAFDFPGLDQNNSRTQIKPAEPATAFIYRLRPRFGGALARLVPLATKPGGGNFFTASSSTSTQSLPMPLDGGVN